MYFNYLEYIPNLLQLNIKNNVIGVEGMTILCNNLKYISNLKELKLDCIINLFR